MTFHRYFGASKNEGGRFPDFPGHSGLIRDNFGAHSRNARKQLISQRKLSRTTINDPGHSTDPGLKRPLTIKKRTRAIWLSFSLWLSNKPSQIKTS